MFLHLHPTRREALTASKTILTRWSLATNPATILTHVSVAPGALFHVMYDAGGRMLTYGGITRTPDGGGFALQQPGVGGDGSQGPGVIEGRSFHHLFPERTLMGPQTSCSVTRVGGSP